MFTTSLRETLTIIGLTLLLTLSIGSVVSAAPVLQADDDGALIVSVRANSPADKAGLMRGDIVLAVDDEAIDGAEALAAAILAYETGDEVVLSVLHGSDTVELPVILGERYGRTYLGVQPYVEAADAPGDDVDTEDEVAKEAAKGTHDTDDGDHEGADGDADKTDHARADDDADMDDDANDDAASDDEDEMVKDLLKGAVIAVIAEVVEESPAAEAGLAEGDFILSVDGKSLGPETDLAALISAFEPGDEVTLEVLSADDKEGEAVEVIVTLGAHPDDEDQAFLGVSYMPAPMMFGGLERLPFGEHMPFSPRGVVPAPDQDDEADKNAGEDESVEDLMSRIFPTDEFGAIVAEVIEDGPAAEAGLAKDDLILAVDGEQVSPEADLADLIRAFEPGDEITLEVLSAGDKEGEAAEVVVTLGAHPDDEEKAYLGISYMPASMIFGGLGRMLSEERMPFSPHNVDPAPEQDEDTCRHPYHNHHHNYHHGDDKDGECEHEGRHPHHGFDRSRDYHGMVPFFGFGMGGHDFEDFDLDQLSEEELEMLQEMMPFLFPDVEAEPESEGGL